MKTKCDHLIGEWQGADEGGVVRASSWDTDTDLEERWKFCPLCGKNTSRLKPKKAKIVELSPMEQKFVDQCSDIYLEKVEKLLKRPSPFLKLLGSKRGKKIPTVVLEREISTDTP